MVDGEELLVDVPGGRVTLSDRRTRTRWDVDVAPFQLAAVPVTRLRYTQVTGQHPHCPEHPGAPCASPEAGGVPADDRRPVVSVTWWEAVAYCNELSRLAGLVPAYRLDPPAERAEWETDAGGYRLPTEAEWEHACRAGRTGPRYGPLDDIAWHRGNSGERVRDVGGRQPNAWGLYDMLGNVWEWCWDHYDPRVYGTYRVLRGGGWFDEHWSVRASVRRRSHPTLRIDDVGFRVARSDRG